MGRRAACRRRPGRSSTIVRTSRRCSPSARSGTARVLGASFDGTGYGDDGSTWGGEFFVGSVRGGFERVAHLRPVRMAGGDAAARHPVQAAAGFLEQLDGLPDLTRPPFHFPQRFTRTRRRCSEPVCGSAVTTSMGRLFDTVAALLGFTRPTTFEGQAAIWLEHLAARRCPRRRCLIPFPFRGGELDFRPLARGRHRAAPGRERAGRSRPRRARGHRPRRQRGARSSLGRANTRSTPRSLSGGVFQNHLLLTTARGREGSRCGCGPTTWCRRTTAASAWDRRRWRRWRRSQRD